MRRREGSGKLVAVEISDEIDNCPCGQEIREHCYIRNRLNGNATYVGNVCINRFIGIDTGNLFEGLKRIAQDRHANANTEVIEYAQNAGYLFEKEYEFLVQTRLKRKLSAKQIAWKEKRYAMRRRPGRDNRTMGCTPSPPTMATSRFGVGIEGRSVPQFGEASLRAFLQQDN